MVRLSLHIGVGEVFSVGSSSGLNPNRCLQSSGEVQNLEQRAQSGENVPTVNKTIS